jgi:hypothetical protein
MQNVIVSTYKNLADSETITFGYRVLEKMEGNPNFTDPPPALAAMKKLLPELQSALGDAKGRDMEAVALKNSKKAELVALLTELADYVNLTSKGIRLKILSSGFLVEVLLFFNQSIYNYEQYHQPDAGFNAEVFQNTS